MLSHNVRDALELLHRARQLACNAERTAEEFSIEISRLFLLGVSPCELRWLLCKGYIQHLTDVTLPNESGRNLRPSNSWRFGKRSCFSLTSTGVHFAEALCTANVSRTPEAIEQVRQHLNSVSVPMWRKDSRELLVNGTTIKKFVVPARNQVRILDAFEEEHWVPQIDDPLPPVAQLNQRLRLNKTIHRLNHSLHPPLLHFSCEHGESISWQRMEPRVAR
jgi:hypothetical protein